MANAQLDENGKPALTALLNTNGTTITRIKAEPSSHGIAVDNGTSGSNNGGSYARLDDNYRPTVYALSSVDGVTKVALYVNSSGELLIDSS